MASPTIITCAVTGSMAMPAQNPAVPVTPVQIADAAAGAARAGASVVHIHVRDPETAAPSMDVELYREVMERIRDSGVDPVINLTTGPGGRYIPSPDDPRVMAEGSTLLPPEERVKHIQALRPEICSLDRNVMWFGSAVMMNTPHSVAVMAKAIRGAGTKPELEVFDSGDIHMAQALIKDGVLERDSLFQLCLGIKHGAGATTESVQYLKSLLPPEAVWAAFGIGRTEFPMVAQSFLLGGHVRVGLEDNIYLEKGVLAPGNAALVERAARIVRDLGGRIATPAEAREILGLRRRDSAAA